MNCKYFIIAGILLILGCSTKVLGNTDSLLIEINAPQLKGQSLILCNYFDGRNYQQDSTVLSDKGKGSFHKSKALPEGLYFVYVDSTKYFDVLLADDQVFKISVDTSDFIKKNKIEGSIQSEAFLEYAQYISGKQKERNHLIEEGRALKAKEKDTKAIEEKLSALSAEVTGFQKAFYAKHQDQWVGKFFKGLDAVETGPYLIPKTREEAIEEFRYQKYHYFDNIDLTDRRFWYTNYFPQKIRTYMDQQVEMIPDSLANAASLLVSKTMGDTICFRMMLSKMTNYGAKSEIMGMENIWAKMAEDYYLKGYAPWADSTFLSNIKSEYKKIKYNRIGMKAHDLALQDSTGKTVNIYDIGSKYTLIYFFEPSCGHCKKTTPEIHETLYKKYHDKGFGVACIYTLTDREEWMKFVHEKNLEDWNNLWDPNRTSYYWQFYDTSVTPGVYLIDENKEIIAKKLDVETLDKLLDALTKDEIKN